MDKIGSDRPVSVIIIGSGTESFIRNVYEALDSYCVEYRFCPDIYLAVVEIAKKTPAAVLGKVEKMNRCGGEFLAMAARANIACCCIVSADSHIDFNNINSAAVVSGESDIMDFLQNNIQKTICKKDIQLNSNEVSITTAEIEALLGV